MKQFNLDEYLKNPKREIVTRDGRLVRRILCVDAEGDYPIVALIKSKDGKEEYPHRYTVNGQYSLDYEKSVDLFFAPEKHEVWINLYKWDNSVGCYVSNPFSSEEKAIEVGKKSNSYLKTVKIEWEE